jgi:hypothetical protein
VGGARGGVGGAGGGGGGGAAAGGGGRGRAGVDLQSVSREFRPGSAESQCFPVPYSLLPAVAGATFRLVRNMFPGSHLALISARRPRPLPSAAATRSGPSSSVRKFT